MAGALWAIAFGLFVLLTLYPFAIYPLVLRLLPRAAPVSPGPGGQSFALLFCAYNEAKALPDVLARLSEVKRIWPDLRILAFNDLSSDGTGALLEEASDILEVIHATDRTGKPAGMRRLLAETAEDVCLFMDANVLVAPETLPRFQHYFADPAVGAVAATVSLSNPGAGAVAATGSAFWRLEEHIKALESRTGSTMGCDGALFAARRRWYPAFPPDLADDMRVSFEAIFQGERCLSAPDILAFEPAATASGDEFRRKRRIACGAWSTHRHMRPGLARMGPMDRFKYASHKWLRWFTGLWIALATLSGAGLAASLGLLLPYLLACLLGAALLWWGPGPLGRVREILAAILATQIGVFESMMGREYRLWTPAASR